MSLTGLVDVLTPEQLKRALYLAAGLVSTLPQFEKSHPEEVLAFIIKEAIDFEKEIGADNATIKRIFS